MIFFDCETYPEKDKLKENKHHLRLKLGVVKFLRLELGSVTREKICVFKTAKQFWDFLEINSSRQRLTLCFAHNAIFDLCTVNLTEFQNDVDWKLSAPYANRVIKKESGKFSSEQFMAALECPPLIICLQNCRTKARVIFIDTLNYFQCSLDELGKTVGLEKLPICFDSCDDIELANYCERDVDIAKEAMLQLIRWQSDLDLGNFRYTLPSNAFNAFRHRFKKHNIIIHDHVDSKKLERQAYYGGQTEVFNPGRILHRVHLVDVSSLYPSVMQDNQFPIKLIDYIEKPNGDILCPQDENVAVIANANLETRTHAFPTKRGSKTVYEDGEFSTVLCQPEIGFARRNFLIKSIDKMAIYETAPIFTDFVNYFWEKRQRYELDGQLVWANLCKLFLNSISGKFAQLTNSWKWLPDMLSEKPWRQWISASEKTGIVDHFRAIGNHVQIKIQREDHPNSFCAISAFVTSFGRERMRILRTISGKQNVYYQGVDCLVINQLGYDNLSNAHEIAHRTLGKLRLVESADTFHACEKMDYEIGSRRVVAGLKKNAIQIAADEFSQTLFSGVESLFAPGDDKNITTQECRFRRANQ